MASFVLQTFSLVYLLLLLTSDALLLNHDEECLALHEFKQTILHQNHDSWRKTKGNTTYFDCCLWDGVVCSNKGHVIGLDWSGSSLGGTINSSSTLFKHVHLQMLNLSMNNFVESQIPSEIARLKHLRSLDLSYSGFSGQIPNELSHLTQLSWLDLSWNPLKLQSSGLEYLLQNMTKLENLHLSGVDLRSPVPRFLANFSSLRSIILASCELQDEFPSEIFYLPKLELLAVGNNSKLTGFLPEFRNNSLLEHINLASTGFAGIIPKSLVNLNHLEFLSVDSCHFSGRIPGSLSNLTQLTYLSLYKNEFTGLVPSLKSLSKLTLLALGYNRFEKGNVYEWIKKLTKLETLDLTSMNINGEILPYFANLTKLSYFSIADNFIFGHIPSSFTNLTQLTTLNLEFNRVQGQISNKLEVLNLGGNSLSFITSNNYTNKTLLELEHLNMGSCNLKEFPTFLRYQTKMKLLFLYENEIEGLVPSWIWNNSRETLQVLALGSNFVTSFHQHPLFIPLIHLEVIQLSHNQLQGRLPIPPKTVVFYDVSYNNLTGEIPPWICEMKSLQLLDLSSNMLIGTLPPCLGNLDGSLFMLALNRNNFHGPMMNMCTRGSLLKEIDLSENQFSGQVPKSLANCTNLEFLSLAQNSFEDVFPLWLGTLPNLRVLLLSSNKFYGSVQGVSTTSSQFLKLRIIDISNNDFSGHLPDKLFQTWNAMKSVYLGGSSAMISQFIFKFLVGFRFQYSMTLTNKGVKREYEKILNVFISIDLSCNNFEGPIPQSLLDLHGLESLNLSHNHFTGLILPSLGNLTNLESLDLSQNELSGQIPQQLLQLGFLAILNVSFNRLDGRIPQGKQFDTFENNSYLGNSGLCGKPLSIECENLKALTILQATSSNDYESLLPSSITDWMVILLGVGSGLVTGILFGNFVYAMYGDCLLERLGMRKNGWVRPLRNTRRN